MIRKTEDACQALFTADTPVKKRPYNKHFLSLLGLLGLLLLWAAVQLSMTAAASRTAYDLILLLLDLAAFAIIATLLYPSVKRWHQTGLLNIREGPRYKTAFEEVALGLAHVNLDGTFLHVNKYLCDFLGYSAAEMLQKRFQDLSLAEELPEAIHFLKEAVAGEIDQSFSSIKRYRHKQGHLVWAKLTTRLIRDRRSKPLYFLSSIQDVSELIHKENQLRRSEERFKNIADSISADVAIWLSSENLGQTLYANRAYAKLWSQDVDALYADPKSFLAPVHPEDRERVEHSVNQGKYTDFSVDYRLVVGAHSIRHIRHTGRTVVDLGSPISFVNSAIDRTELVEHQARLDTSLLKLNATYQQLQQVARLDALTGALNRSAFKERVEDALQRYGRYRTPATLVFIDLDRFREINDSWGQSAGDRVLVCLAERLKSLVRQTDAVGRHGGDEFALLLPNSSAEQALEFCHRLGETVRVEVEKGEAVEAGISVGICELCDDIVDAEEWMRLTDQQLYRKKQEAPGQGASD